ncbi:MAG: DUF222 domain-containing protein [Acidimicrobiia bacterium]|nr:DUF222 domain-containing protein [Acidimicrobiia bacterium]
MTTEAEYSADGDPVNPFPVDWLGDDEMVPELQRLHRLKAQAEAREAAVIARVHRRGVPHAQGFASPTAWLIAATGEAPAVCRSRVRVALALQHMDHTRQAFAAGELSECRVRLLVDARAGAPDLFRRDEPLLVEQARTLSARVFPKALSHWRRLADPDGARFDAEAAFLARRLHISPTWERTVRVDGDLDPESGQIVLTAIRSLAEPAALEPGDGRTPAQRRADALVEICRRHLDSADRPTQNGERPHVTLALSLADLAGDGLIDLETGPITAETARRLACDATITPITLDGAGQPQTAGDARRSIPPALRRALDLRDGGCTHPGCDIPARWCDAHHIIHWAHRGKTTLTNLRLLCRPHHRTAHHHQPYPRRQ